MSLPLSSQPLSSLLPGLEHTDSISSITPSLPSTTDAPWSQGHNRRFSLWGKFPNNGDEPEIEHQVGVSGYADSFFQQPLLAMSLGSPPEEERLSRKSKSENRFYNFLTRSRSRSRSKQEENSTASTLQTIPHNNQRSMRHSSDTQSKHTQGSKPASRIPSRPLSSTTTATNTTVTPGAPRASKRSAIPVSPSNAHENTHPSRPTTPKPSAARKTLQTLFGIPLALASRTSSRSRSRSRPNSPRPSLDVPPLPTSRIEDDSTPKPRKSLSPHPISPPNSPTPASKHKNIDSNLNNVSTGSTSGSMRLPRFFSGRSTQPDANGLQRPKDSAIATVVSAPLRRPSNHRRSLKSGAEHETLADPPSNARPHASAAPPPKIIHTPATPLKGGGPASPSEPATGRLTHNWKNSSLDSGYRYRGATMGVVDEESKTGPELAKSTSVKGKEKMTELLPRTGLKKMSNTTRATKHGSFDFERPGWGALMMQRTGSGGTTGTTTSGWSRENTQKERESAFGPGLAGVGTLQRDASVKRGRDREEQVKARERGKRLEQYIEKDKIASAQKTPQGSSSAHSDHPGASTSTNGTGHTGKSSSMSKATGKKSFFGNSTSGAARLGTQHGLFSFEHPVLSTRSTGSTGTNPEVAASGGGRAEQEKERLREERERQRDRERKAPQRGDRPPVPVPSVGHRSGTKGRSLDLGLGLAWAPTKMREDALMPSSAFFNRSLSNTSSGRTASASTGRSASSSTTGNGSGRSRRIRLQDSEPDVERSKLGRDVAEVFRSALDADGYTSFKTYVHQFDAHEIPFDGPTGIIPRVERLLSTAPGLSEEGKRQLLDNFVRVILQHA